jgi:hypothetical protein
MQITYLSDMLYSTDFVYALIFLTLAIWLIMKYMLNYDNASHALIFAVLAVVFLPFVVNATQVGSAFIITLLLGGLAISQTFKWPISTSILAVFIAMIAGAVLLPTF